ncbi:MAG TPA: TatD family deoxyribonuclease [Gammaproteobacteria bacterium]|nr:TatD family deoxyribonuclease [Gammaproteobacteria bacterium]
MLVDSHCHLDRLDFEALGQSLDETLAFARKQGVSHMLCVSIGMSTVEAVRRLAHLHTNVFASVGSHPSEQKGEEPGVARLVQLSDDPAVVAIGETGLDYHYCKGDLEWQRQRFRHHIRAAREIGKPLIVHSRDAEEDTLRILREERAFEAGAVLHCFTGTMDMALQAVDMGLYVSFSGIVTFKNAGSLRAVARALPASALLVETDAPYLTPVPLRGKPNQPAHVRHVAECVATCRNESLDTLADVTTNNFFTLFKHARRA